LHLGEDVLDLTRDRGEPARAAGGQHELLDFELAEQQVQQLPFAPQDLRDLVQGHAKAPSRAGSPPHEPICRPVAGPRERYGAWWRDPLSTAHGLPIAAAAPS